MLSTPDCSESTASRVLPVTPRPLRCDAADAGAPGTADVPQGERVQVPYACAVSRGGASPREGGALGGPFLFATYFYPRAVPAWSFHVATRPIFFLTPAGPGVTVSSRLQILPPEVTGPGPPQAGG